MTSLLFSTILKVNRGSVTIVHCFWNEEWLHGSAALSRPALLQNPDFSYFMYVILKLNT